MKNNISAPTCKHQRGIVLIAMLVTIVISLGIFFVNNLSVNKKILNNQKHTRQSLAQAKQALINYAVSYYENSIDKQYALLPCPELSGSVADGRQQTGACRARNVNVIGRLPWFTLKIPPLVDGSGECLWYAVSGGYKFAASGQSKMLNDDTPGMFQVYDDTGNVLLGRTPEDRIVALVIAPGRPLAGQNRAAANTNKFCKIDRGLVDINNYLDNINGINNADVTNTADSIDSFVSALNFRNENINDQILAIYQTDIFAAIHANQAFKNNMNNLTHILSACIANYGRMQACVSGRQCINNCDTTFNVCMNVAAGVSTAENDCRIERALCLNVNTCNIACDFNQGGLAVPDAVVTQMNLPLPTAMDSNADYRLNANYVDLNTAQANDVNIGLLGRYMFDVANSISNSAVDNIFEACGAIDIAAISPAPINMADKNNVYRKLWQHWKDHFFYVVGRDMTALNASAVSCAANCPTLASASQTQAALVWYAGGRLQNQHRQSIPPEPNTYNIPAGFGKASIENYLEFMGGVLYPDINGNASYQKAATSNDIFYCIDQNMGVTLCP